MMKRFKTKTVKAKHKELIILLIIAIILLFIGYYNKNITKKILDIASTKIEEACVFDMELHSISVICNKENIRLMSLKKVTDNLSIDKYYEQIAQKEIFELTSILDKLIIESKDGI